MPEKLWVPGEQLEYEQYTQKHLLEDWTTLYNNASPQPTIHVGENILGVLNVPEEEPTKIASIDLCDVLRQTHVATAKALGKDYEHIGHDIWIYTPTLGLNKKVAPEIVKAVMNADLVDPVEDIEEISDIMRGWKQEGVYVVANTSTLPNCERATIRNLLARELPGCFDGIVLPRNHYGGGSVTKGDALQAVAARVADEDVLEKALHIDDAPHHIQDVGEIIGDIAINSVVIMPVYKPGGDAEYKEPAQVDSLVVKAVSPLDAFEKASEFLFDS